MKDQLELLIIDDNPADYHLIRRWLLSGLKSKAILNITHCEDKKTSLNILQNQSFDCIILDYILGAENGITVLKELLVIAPETPVIIMTGEGDETIAVEAMKLGAADYLVKENTSSESISLAVLNSIEKAQLSIKLRDKQRELEDFAYTAAHDIKSPLAIINQTAQLIDLHNNVLQDAKISEHSKVLLEVSKQLTEFISELLDYAKAGRHERKLKIVSLDEVIRQAVGNLAAIIGDTLTTIHIDSQLPEIKGDAVALMQLFQNLISNGIKFKRAGTHPVISIRLLPVKEHESSYDFKIAVEDNGIGIEVENLKKIFSPLVRLKNAENVEGAGLGLAIATKIIEQHQAKMWVESCFGEGTVVNILFKSDPDADT